METHKSYAPVTAPIPSQALLVASTMMAEAALQRPATSGVTTTKKKSSQ